MWIKYVEKFVENMPIFALTLQFYSDILCLALKKQHVKNYEHLKKIKKHLDKEICLM